MKKTVKSAYILLLVFFLTGSELLAQSASDLRRQADQYYQTEQFEQAEEYYRKSLALERSPEALFNLGNALYKQGRFEEAAGFFEAARDGLGRSGQRADAWYNYGNARFEEMDLESAIEAYRNALLDEPEHSEARNNLLLSKMLLEQMQNQEQQQTAQAEESEGEEGDEQDFMESPDREEDGEDEEHGEDEADDSLADAYQQEDGGSPDLGEDPLEEISDQRLEQLLQIAEQDDQQTRRRMNERQSDRGQSLRDW